MQLIAKFDATGSVGNINRVYERDDASEMALLGNVARYPTLKVIVRWNMLIQEKSQQ